MSLKNYFPGEWEPQSGVLLAWPGKHTDWAPIMEEVIPVYERFAAEIIARERLLLVCDDKRQLPASLTVDQKMLTIREIPYNDTWVRDYGPLTVIEEGLPVLLNFGFNGWGMKFPACFDNQVAPRLHTSGAFREGMVIRRHSDFIFEGGSVESNAAGCLLTTEQCLLSPNRNEHLPKEAIEKKLKNIFHAEKIIWLKHGFLEGDDTDSHIDTLARFCSANTIACVKCVDPHDIHFDALRRMEDELTSATDAGGRHFNLVHLPFPDPVFDDQGNRLPATYANFLIINDAVIVPVYGVDQDDEALAVISHIFPEREVIGINAIPLVKQHGSIHCISMQFPHGVL